MFKMPDDYRGDSGPALPRCAETFSCNQLQEVYASDIRVWVVWLNLTEPKNAARHLEQTGKPDTGSGEDVAC